MWHDVLVTLIPVTHLTASFLQARAFELHVTRNLWRLHSKQVMTTQGAWRVIKELGNQGCIKCPHVAALHWLPFSSDYPHPLPDLKDLIW